MRSFAPVLSFALLPIDMVEGGIVLHAHSHFLWSEAGKLSKQLHKVVILDGCLAHHRLYRDLGLLPPSGFQAEGKLGTASIPRAVAEVVNVQDSYTLAISATGTDLSSHFPTPIRFPAPIRWQNLSYSFAKASRMTSELALSPKVLLP